MEKAAYGILLVLAVIWLGVVVAGLVALLRRLRAHRPLLRA